jgi:hypothetical protein
MYCFVPQMPIWDHLEELRERVLVGALAAAVAIGGCFCFSKELVLFLEAPVADAGVRFLQLSPGEFFFTTFKVCQECGVRGVWECDAQLRGSAEHVLTETLCAVDLRAGDMHML